MADFACSFDAVTPLAPWTSGTGTIVAGRNVNGVSTGSLVANGSWGTIAPVDPDTTLATAYLGAGWKVFNFSDTPLVLADASTAYGGFIRIGNMGDGRLRLQCGNDVFGVTDDQLLNIGLVVNQNEWYYAEIGGTLQQTVTPNVDPTKADIAVTVTANLYINNVLMATCSKTYGATLLLAQVPSGSWNRINIRNGTFDDVYAQVARIGDCYVQSDDITVTVETSAPDITQTVIEVGTVSNVVAPDITQTVIEVGIRPGPPDVPVAFLATES